MLTVNKSLTFDWFPRILSLGCLWCFLCFWDHITWSLFKQIYSLNTIERNPLDRVQLSSVAELSQTQSNVLHLICLIEFHWFRNRTHPKFGVCFCWIAKLNPLVEFNWVWFLNVRLTMPGCVYTPQCGSVKIITLFCSLPECILTYSCSNVRVKCVISKS